MIRDKKSNIEVKGIAISILSNKADDYICLTDMAKFRDYRAAIVVQNWLTTKYTIQFIGGWELIHNPNFKVMEFHDFRNEVGTNGFIRPVPL